MPPVPRDLPAGTVTFLFSDVEGSTKLLNDLGAHDYAQALAEHRRIVREAISAHGGVEVDTQGDAFVVAFPTAQGALGAAAEARERMASGPIWVRMGIRRVRKSGAGLSLRSGTGRRAVTGIATLDGPNVET